MNTLNWFIGMGATNWERVIIAIFCISGITILGMYEKVSPETLSAVYSGITFYILGHGAGVKSEKISNNEKHN